MDPRGPPQYPHHHHHHHPPPPGMMVYQPPPPPPQPNLQNPQNPSQMMTTHHFQTQARFPFNSPVVNNNNNSNSTTTQTQQQQQQQHTPAKPTTQEPLNSPFSGDGSSGFNAVSSQKKKRGRPRKYSPDGGGVGSGGSNIALGLAPAPSDNDGGGGDESGGHGQLSKKNRGRPPGSSKKQLDALGNCGVGFTPHVILVNSGEDVASKILAFSKEGPRTVCILSANGAVSKVSLRQPANSGGILNYEGRFEIISLSGSFLFSETSGGIRSGGLSVSLAGSDGRVLGGCIAGMLVAATQVQIIVGSFIAGGKKLKYMPSIPNSQLSSFASPPDAAAETPPSQEASSEASEENGSNHIDRNMGSYGNSNHPMHHNMQQMYSPMGWPNSGSKMLPS